ncbi:cell wall-binding repeat-containing protein [Microbacterium sp. NPDC056569]|uniref:cell wall-binding repeat-containing protein n=1 Tax=Microbacterium sp. NPDC056569 TaxID=3345867 RepID=UPI00366AAB1E
MGSVAVDATPALAAVDVTRVSGPDRYATSAAVSARSFPAGAPVVFLASGERFPDALSAGPAAARLGGPVLLTRQSEMPASIAAEVQRLLPERVVILGGDPSVSETQREQIQALLPQAAVERWAGEDRYQTSALVSARTAASGVDTVFLASGEVFPDALSGTPAASLHQTAMLLTRPDSLPPDVEAELIRLAPDRVVVLGGTPSVSDSVTDRVAQVVSAPVERWAGADRYATSADIAARAYPAGAPVVYLASGEVFADALSGAPAAAREGGPVLLTPSVGLPPVTVAELRRLKPARLVFLGSTPSISAAAAQHAAYVAAPLPAATAGRLTRASEISAGTCLPSPDTSHALCASYDGRLTVMRGSTQLWTSGTTGAGSGSVRIRTDGNLVFERFDGGIIWQSSTAGTTGTELLVQNDGEVVLRDAAGQIIWSSMSGPTAPRWRLPFAAGQRWASGAPHTNTGGTGARGSLDFGPTAGGDRRVLSIADGVVYRVQCTTGSYLGINHANGWQSTYYHLVNYQDHLVGQFVPAGTYLGDVGRTVPCGGGATFDHVHLTIRRAGVPVSVEGMTFGGFQTHSDGRDYWGFWTDAAGNRVLTAPGGAGCCLLAR